MSTARSAISRSRRPRNSPARCGSASPMPRTRLNRRARSSGSRPGFTFASPPALLPRSSEKNAVLVRRQAAGVGPARAGGRLTGRVPPRSPRSPDSVRDALRTRFTAVRTAAAGTVLPRAGNREDNDAPIQNHFFSDLLPDGRPAGGLRACAGGGAGDRRGARHRDPGAIRPRSRRGRPVRGHRQVRVDRRTGAVRDRRRSGRLLRRPCAARTPHRGTADGDRPSGRDGDGGLRTRSLARSRGRDGDRLGGRNRDRARGIQRGHQHGRVRYRARVGRESRRRPAERTGDCGARLRPRSRPADHSRLRRRPGHDSGGRRPHRGPVERVRRPRRRGGPEQRGTRRNRPRAGDVALRLERGRRARQRDHAPGELPGVAAAGYAGEVQRRPGKPELAGGRERQRAARAGERSALLGLGQHAADGGLQHARGGRRELRHRGKPRAGRPGLDRRPVLHQRRGDRERRPLWSADRRRVPRTPR